MGQLPGYAALVLAGGAGRRLGGTGKPTLPVRGRPMLHRVLDAVADAEVRIVVGPPELPLLAGVTRTQEEPPGCGPVAATAAGIALVPQSTPVVALLAADLPLLTVAAIRALRQAVAQADAGQAETRQGACYVDNTGRPQWLCGVWRADALRDRLANLPAIGTGPPLRSLLAGLPAARLASPAPIPPPWWDCDTGTELQRAEELADAQRQADTEGLADAEGVP